MRKIGYALQAFFNNRIVLLMLIFAVMSSVMVSRLVQLQLIDGKKYAENFTIKTTKTKTLRSSRGNIYDARGKLLAYNERTNSITIADNGTYETMRQKNLALNGEIYTLVSMILSHGDVLSMDFHIIVDENGEYVFDTDSEATIDRFRADVYGYRTVEELKPEERKANPNQIMHDLGCQDRFGLFYEVNPYTPEELRENGLPEELTKQEALYITNIRYQLGLISFQRYMSVTVATDVSDNTVAAVMENSDILPGVEVTEDYIRVYNSSDALSPILGYTGKPSSEELESLQAEDARYTSQSVIGKAGIEQSMERYLQGTDGTEEVTVDNLGRVLSENTASMTRPVQGQDIYLTIDSELQNACYKILEQRIAGIILMYLTDAKSVNLKNIEDIDTVPIPSYDVYYALINNEIIDVEHFLAEDATANEKDVQARFEVRLDEILNWIREELMDEDAPAYNRYSIEQKVYFDYIFDNFLSLKNKIMKMEVIDTTDEIYQAYITGENISPRAFLQNLVNKDWIDLAKLKELDSSYLTTNEIYQEIIDYLIENLRTDKAFNKLIYKYMLLNDILDPRELCLILYDQGILNGHEDSDNMFLAGETTPFEFITSKIRNLELTPAMLALDPCSGSIVITDPDTGYVKACVTYPGYDNTRLANNMDTDYYNKVNGDLSTPFYNKATQQVVAPGSTFKPVTAAAALDTGAIDPSTEIVCTGLFGPGLVPESDYVECWRKEGHYEENVIQALGDSCNVFFCTCGYLLGLDEMGGYTQSKALASIRHYSELFGLDKKSGVQIPEMQPQVSDSLPIPSAMGQGTHLYSTVQLARYVNTIATKGRCYNLSLVEKITDSEGNTVKQFEPEQIAYADLSDTTWKEIYDGMQMSVDEENIWSNKAYPKILVRGKTGTAQESKVRSDHALTIGFTKVVPKGQRSEEIYANMPDYDERGEIAYAIRIGNGYTSRNTNLVSMDMLYYYYGIMDESQVIIDQADPSEMVRLVQEG
ncbi:MAG: peptidase [Eubacterium sp.]|nr:peptidase [Eubacterium sp.]